MLTKTGIQYRYRIPFSWILELKDTKFKVGTPYHWYIRVMNIEKKKKEGKALTKDEKRDLRIIWDNVK